MEIVNLSLTLDQFKDYLKTVVLPKIQAGSWKAHGAVLHNTDLPRLSAWPGNTPVHQPVHQRLLNIAHGYDMKGWSAGPHMFIDTKTINLFTPMWQHGIHSPSYNHLYWGVEMVGNFDLETFPESMHELALGAIRAMYDILDITPSADNFHFHKEDPATTHKHCPGANVGVKEDWIKNLNGMAKPNTPAIPADPIHLNTIVPHVEEPKVALLHNQIPDIAEKMVEQFEAFRSTQYMDRGFPAIGFGRRQGFRGFVITPGMVCTETQAAQWLKEDLAYIGSTFAPLLTHEVNNNQYGALASFVYNIGLTNFKASTMLKLLNTNDFANAVLEFPKWDRSTNPVTHVKEELPGLLARRQAEARLFKTPV